MNPARMALLDKLFRQIESDWKKNNISWAIALRRLCAIGWSHDQAAHWLAKN